MLWTNFDEIFRTIIICNARNKRLYFAGEPECEVNLGFLREFLPLQDTGNCTNLLITR